MAAEISDELTHLDNQEGDKQVRKDDRRPDDPSDTSRTAPIPSLLSRAIRQVSLFSRQDPFLSSS